MKRPLIVAAAAAFAIVLLAGCAPTTTSPTSAGQATSASSGLAGAGEWDVTKLCGDKDIKVALADGTGGNNWRKMVVAEFKAEAAKCPNITDVYYANANADPQKAAADINGFVAQGVDVLVVLPDFGVSQLPALRAAEQAGVTVIPYYARLDGTVGTDFSDNVTINNLQGGLDMADWFGANVGSGNVVVFGGPPSCPSCQELYDGVQQGLAKYPNLTLVGDGPVATDYNPEAAQRAAAGLISKYGSIAAFASDSGIVALPVLSAFDAAGQPAPAVGLFSGTNAFYCDWNKRNDAGAPYALTAYEDTTQLVRAALRRGLADFNGISYDEPLNQQMPKRVDTVASMDPPACDTSLPADTDMFTALDPAEVRQVLAG